MDYASWMRAQFASGASPVAIARSALQLPIASPATPLDLAPLLQQAATLLKIDPAQFHVIGSARFGFSLRDGALFDPRFSTLDVAIVDPQLYRRCGGRNDQLTIQPRLPDLELPVPEGLAFRRMADDLSRLVLDRFAYVSFTVYPNFEALVSETATKIHAYLDDDEEISQDAPPTLESSFGHEPFAAAVRNGLPRFLGKVSESPPGKASPYRIDESGFWQAFGTSPVRRQLLDALDQALSDMRCIVDVACCLVGGSFVDPQRPDPRDIDMVVFYRALGHSDYEPGHALAHLSRKFKLRSIDVRFVPYDAEPWLLVKMASFFTSLYHSDRDPSGHQRGLVLLIPNMPPNTEQPVQLHDRPAQVASLTTA